MASSTAKKLTKPNLTKPDIHYIQSLCPNQAQAPQTLFEDFSEYLFGYYSCRQNLIATPKESLNIIGSLLICQPRPSTAVYNIETEIGIG